MNIKKLVTIFSEHEIEAKKRFQEDLQRFIENNPGIEPPDHFKDSFNICSAMKLMCEEIVSIKEKLEME